VMLAAVVSVIFVAPTSYMLLDTAPPLIISEIRVKNSVVPRGGNLEMAYIVDRRRFCDGEIMRVFVDSRGTLFPLEPYRFLNIGKLGQLKLGEQKIEVSAPVPLGAAPGEAKYFAVLAYYCNWLQRKVLPPIEVITTPQIFTISDEIMLHAPTPIPVPGAIPASPQDILKILPELKP